MSTNAAAVNLARRILGNNSSDETDRRLAREILAHYAPEALANYPEVTSDFVDNSTRMRPDGSRF